MKFKIIAVAFLCLCLQLNAQENEVVIEENSPGAFSLQNTSIGVFATYGSDLHTAGIVYENKGIFSRNENSLTSLVLRVGLTQMDYDLPVPMVLIKDGNSQYFELENGEGMSFQLGVRHYLNDEHKGFHAGNFLQYSYADFNQAIGDFTFSGKYSYISFFAPEVGYKAEIFSNFYANLFVGGMWKIEIENDGDIDNRFADNWAVRGGLSLSFQF